MNILKNNEILLELSEIAKKYNLSLLVLFGSRAKGTYKTSSDYDFAYIAPSNFTTENKINLIDDLMFLFKTEKIDLINILQNHDTKLRYEIFFSGKMIYEKKKSLFSDLKGKAFIDYIDFNRFSKRNSEILGKAIFAL